MAKIIPSMDASGSDMTRGERRFAECIEEKLEDDYWCWYDLWLENGARRPDFVLLHPGRGVLVLEVKDWRLETIHGIDKYYADIATGSGIKRVLNPLEQARRHMFRIKEMLERERSLVHRSGKFAGHVCVPHGCGVVLYNITRRQFDNTNLREVLPPDLVICGDEFASDGDAEGFQRRLWRMFPWTPSEKLSLPQVDAIRTSLSPQVCLGAEDDLSGDAGDDSFAMPEVVQVLDEQQKRLACNLGEGHRVIHGVAGSGKTMILGYRAERLATLCRRPILVLCFNKSLAAKLAVVMEEKGLASKVSAMSFHRWCMRQLETYHVIKPPEDNDKTKFFEACVECVIHAVERNHIPKAQYDAVLIDEGHDFKPEWFKLIVQMIHPDSNSLLVLYDDAQSIYNGPKKLRFTFSSVGIQAKGRTTILKLNYRNTEEIMAVATAFAQDLLIPGATEDDEAPTVQPMSAGRHGPEPVLKELSSFQEEAELIAGRLVEAHRCGMAWRDMAVIYRNHGTGMRIASALKRKRIPFQCQKNDGFSPGEDSVKGLTMHSSKGLEFPLVCIPGLGDGSPTEVSNEEARLLYVAMTRATQQLVMTHTGTSAVVRKVRRAMSVLQAS